MKLLTLYMIVAFLYYRCIVESILLNLLFQLIFVYNLFEIPQPFRSVVKNVLLLNTFTNNFVEDDLKAYRDATALKVGVVILSYFLYFRVLFGWRSPLSLRLLHSQIKIITVYFTTEGIEYHLRELDWPLWFLRFDSLFTSCITFLFHKSFCIFWPNLYKFLCLYESNSYSAYLCSA